MALKVVADVVGELQAYRDSHPSEMLDRLIKLKREEITMQRRLISLYEARLAKRP